MKSTLEIATNIVLIALACLVGYRFWHAGMAPGSAQADSVKVGDQLQLPAYDWSGHERTLVLALKNGCRFCEESVPFYRRLLELEKSNQTDAHLIAVFPDHPIEVRNHLAAQQLEIEAFPEIELVQMKVAGTPTLILVDRRGQVSRVWLGELTPAWQADVVASVTRAGELRPTP